MVDNDTSEDKQLRRDFLKTGITTLGTTGLAVSAISAEAAKQAGLSLGETTFIETIVEHDVPDDQALGETDGLRRYSLARTQSRMGLVADPAVDVFSDAEAVISIGRDFFEAPATVYGNESSVLTVQADYESAVEKVLFIESESEYKQPKIKISSVDDGTVKGHIEDTEIIVKPGDEESVTLPDKEVVVAKDTVRLGEKKPKPEYTTITVTPKAKVQNNGTVEVFGKKELSVVPMNQKDPFAERFRRMRKENEQSKTVAQNGAELFVAKRGGH